MPKRRTKSKRSSKKRQMRGIRKFNRGGDMPGAIKGAKGSEIGLAPRPDQGGY